MSRIPPVIALHGGAGTILPTRITPEIAAEYHAALRACLEAGLAVLRADGPALDAVTASVMALEDDPLFNAGRGAVFTSAGTHEMDAAVMSGADRACGAVTGICGPRHPVLAARAVMELLSAAYTLHPAFAEAELVETGAGLRPAFPDNLPTIRQQDGRIHVNGCYRHGFLMAPDTAQRLVNETLQFHGVQHAS
ncbi:FAD-dependent oxidoreductase [Thioclava sp. BHET1]|nr:FAD-dependent oxidoreductase [Thioclava sp. BHET1]